MKASRLALLAACASLAALAAAHHASPRDASGPLAHHGRSPSPEVAGPGHFVSTYPGGDFVLPKGGR